MLPAQVPTLVQLSGKHLPALQLSPSVHAVPSSQVPVTAACVQAPVAAVQASSVQVLTSSQSLGGNAHCTVLASQVSTVQALSSEHGNIAQAVPLLVQMAKAVPWQLLVPTGQIVGAHLASKQEVPVAAQSVSVAETVPVPLHWPILLPLQAPTPGLQTIGMQIAFSHRLLAAQGVSV